MLTVKTEWGNLPAQYKYERHAGGAKTLAVLFPGRGYSLDAPIMWYAAKAAYGAGCDVLGIEYGYQANRVSFEMEGFERLVSEAVSALETVLTDSAYSDFVFIGKSLGTRVQSEVAKKAQLSVSRHVFLTPLQPVISSILASDRALVIVGDNDPAFTPEDVAAVRESAGVTVHIMAAADHSLETPDMLASIGILQTTAQLCQAFCQPASSPENHVKN